MSHVSLTHLGFWRQPRLIAALLAAVAMTPCGALGADTHSKAHTPPVISNGQKVSIADYVVPGKTTIFDFYSEHCPTCRSLRPGILKLHEERGNIAVVMVNIDRPGSKGIDWNSPVSKQYDLPSTPQFKVYGPDCRLTAEGKPAYDLVTGWIK